jgi:DNA-binding response OmpR family regulator
MLQKTILSISYDDTLLQTRHLMLERCGYSVTSTFGFTDSLEQCKRGHWSLLIIGHSIPDPDKRALVKQFRRNCSAPVLALHRFGDSRLDDADYTITVEHPQNLLQTVEQILAEPEAAGKSATN